MPPVVQTVLSATNPRPTTALRKFRTMKAPVAKSDAAAVLTAAEMIDGLVIHTISTGRTLTTPTGAEISTGWVAYTGAVPKVGDFFELTVQTVGTGADDISTLTAGATGVTVTGKATVGPDIADAGPPHGTFRCRNTATDTWICYRI